MEAFDKKRFLIVSSLRTFISYCALSFSELLLMTIRTSNETQILSPIAGDLLSKFAILLLSSAIFGFSFIIFHAKALPSAAKRFIHILLNYVPVFLILRSLENDTNLDMQARVFGYFAFTLLYLLIYGLCMLVRFIWRKKKNQ